MDKNQFIKENLWEIKEVSRRAYNNSDMFIISKREGGEIASLSSNRISVTSIVNAHNETLLEML